MNRRIGSPQRFLYLLSGAFFLSAVVHFAVFLSDGSSWAGPVSWRKPVEFAFSFALTTATLAWILDYLGGRAMTQWTLAIVYAAASVGEVVLITMQVWRGVPSHFNFTTAFDSAIFSVMGALVIVITAVSLVVLVWAFRVRPPAAPSLLFAIRAGLGLLVVGQLIGFGLLQQGLSIALATPTSYLQAPSLGSLALPHAIALHAVQVLPLLVLLARRTHTLERDRMRIAIAGVAGYTTLVAGAVVHALGDNGMNIGIGAGALLVPGILALGAAGIAALLPLPRAVFAS
jgi:hypothetical protein